MARRIRSLGAFKLQECPSDLIAFIVAYRNEVATRLARMQNGDEVDPREDIVFKNCKAWSTRAHRHAEKLFKLKDPIKPDSIAYKVTVDTTFTAISYESGFPLVGHLELNSEATQKFMFRLPLTSQECMEEGIIDMKEWGVIEILLTPSKYKPSRLTNKCIFWYFPEQETVEFYAFTY